MKGDSVLTDAKAFQSFSVDDIGKARSFYHDTLGLDVKESPMGLELEVWATVTRSSSIQSPTTSRRRLPSSTSPLTTWMLQWIG